MFEYFLDGIKIGCMAVGISILVGSALIVVMYVSNYLMHEWKHRRDGK